MVVDLDLVALVVLVHELVLRPSRVAQLAFPLVAFVAQVLVYTYLRQVSPNVCWAELET